MFCYEKVVDRGGLDPVERLKSAVVDSLATFMLSWASRLSISVVIVSREAV